METKKIADILLNMSLDMDYSDYIEFYEESVSDLDEELNKLKNADSPLYKTLEVIAKSNENMYQWAL